MHLSACNETNYPLIDGVTFHAVISSKLAVYDTWNPPSTKKEWNTFRRVDIIIYLFFQELLIFQVRIRKIVQQENITRNKIENLGKMFFRSGIAEKLWGQSGFTEKHMTNNKIIFNYFGHSPENNMATFSSNNICELWLLILHHVKRILENFHQKALWMLILLLIFHP